MAHRHGSLSLAYFTYRLIQLDHLDPIYPYIRPILTL